jgi:hypothetical protein
LLARRIGEGCQRGKSENSLDFWGFWVIIIAIQGLPKREILVGGFFMLEKETKKTKILLIMLLASPKPNGFGGNS